MAHLKKVKFIYGYCLKNDQVLNISEYDNVIFDDGALYKNNGKIIIESVMFRGVDKYHILNKKVTTDLNFDNRNIISKNCIWIGHIPDHFGHFIINLASTLWSINNFPDDYMIAYSGVNVEDILKKRIHGRNI